MTNKAIKTAFLILIICMVIVSTTNVFGYEVKVTKDNLQKAFNEYAKGYSGAYTDEDGNPRFFSFGESKAIEVTDTQLIDTNGFEDCTADYSLDGDLIFSTKIIFNKDSDLNIVSDMDNMLKAPLLGLIGTSIVQGADLGEAYVLYDDAEEACDTRVESSSYSVVNVGKTATIKIDEVTKEFKQEDFKPSEVINFMFKNKTVKDEKYGVYTYTFTINETSAESVELKAVLEIKKDADFSKVIKMHDTEETKNTTDNTTANTNKVSNTSTTNKVSSSTVNTNKTAESNTKTSNTTIASTDKIPDTGIDHTVIYIIGLVCVIAFVFFIKIEKINKDMK